MISSKKYFDKISTLYNQMKITTTDDPSFNRKGTSDHTTDQRIYATEGEKF
jgi:hypothetical protein